MVKTAVAQDFFLGAKKQEPKILYAEITNVAFNTKDKMMVMYLEQGYQDQVENQLTKQMDTKNVIVNNVKLKYSQSRFKDCILASGNDFNHEDTNMIIDEMIRVADDVIMKMIDEKPGDFFDKAKELWQKA